MNKQIKALIKQATEVRQPAPHSNQTENSIVFNKEKFAELIVRECVEVANNHFESKEPGYPGDKIEQHFGVE